jgi:hypothetical protein
MTRRVIFPPADYWTRPKENTMTHFAETPSAADARRATALTLHHRGGDTDGVVELVRETAETDRAAELLMAILDLHRTAILELKTDQGVTLMALYVQDLANVPTTPDPVTADVRRAAALLDCHGRTDITGLNNVLLDAADTGRPTQLVVALLDLYEHLLPELSSNTGTRWLNRCISNFANEEAQTE